MAEAIAGAPSLDSPDASSSSSAPATVPVNVFKGWAAVQHAVNVELPQALARADRVRAATLRELASG